MVPFSLNACGKCGILLTLMFWDLKAVSIWAIELFKGLILRSIVGDWLNHLQSCSVSVSPICSIHNSTSHSGKLCKIPRRSTGFSGNFRQYKKTPPPPPPPRAGGGGGG